MKGKRMFQEAAVAAVLLIAMCVPMAQAVTYSGSLNAGENGGIVATDGWVNAATVFSWTVTEVGTVDGFILWQYDYAFTVPKKDISHMIIEVSEGALEADFSSFVPAKGILDEYSSTSGGNSNPNMPEKMWGLKFQPGGLTLSASFRTTRAPVWGDFYAKDGQAGGQDVTAWNAGFVSADPLARPANGSLNYHILRPDTHEKPTTGQVPEPTALMLLGLGLVGMAVARRGRR